MKKILTNKALFLLLFISGLADVAFATTTITTDKGQLLSSETVTLSGNTDISNAVMRQLFIFEVHGYYQSISYAGSNSFSTSLSNLPEGYYVAQYIVLGFYPNYMQEIAQTEFQVFSGPGVQITGLSDNDICAGETVSFIANSHFAGTAPKFEWFLNGVSQGAPSTNSTFATNDLMTNGDGVYVTVLPDTDAVSQDPANSETATFNVSTSVATPAVTLTKDNVCYGQEAVFTADATNTEGIVSYQWSRHGQMLSGETSPSLHTSNISIGGEDISVTVTNNNGCQASTTYTEHVHTDRTFDPNTTYLTASGSTKMCAGDMVTFTAKSAGKPGASFTWNRDGVAIPGEAGTTYTTDEAGDITLTVSNMSGCGRTSGVRTINARPLAEAMATGPTEFCQGNSVMLEATLVDSASYRWKQNGDSRGNTPTQEAKTAGSYTVTVTKNSCAATSAPIIITPILTNTSVTATTPTTVCAPNTVTLQAAQDAGYTYQWYRSTVPVSGATNSSFDATMSGNYKVAVSNNGCASKNSVSTMATINAVPVATITRTANAYTYNNLRATGGTGISYQWYMGGTAIPAATGRDYSATTSGSYTVVVMKAGCSDSTATAYDVLLGNGARMDEVADARSISVYPNPSEGIFYIGSEERVNVVVKDIQGRTIISQNHASQVDLSTNAAGMYMLLISDLNGKLLQTKRVMKQ